MTDQPKDTDWIAEAAEEIADGFRLDHPVSDDDSADIVASIIRAHQPAPDSLSVPQVRAMATAMKLPGTSDHTKAWNACCDHFVSNLRGVGRDASADQPAPDDELDKVIGELERLEAKATKGPLHIMPGDYNFYYVAPADEGARIVADYPRRDDAEFDLALRNALPALVGAIRDLRARCREAEAARDMAVAELAALEASRGPALMAEWKHNQDIAHEIEGRKAAAALAAKSQDQTEGGK